MKTKTGRTRRLATIAATLTTAGAAMAGMTGIADASTYQPGVACWGSHDGMWLPIHKVRPTRCTFNGDEAHAYTTTITQMRFGSWGGKTACGHGVVRYNAGYRTRVAFCLYKLHPVEGYMRVRGTTSIRGCAYDESGEYHCFRQPVRHFDNSTS